MPTKPSLCVVGPGSLGTALTHALHGAGYVIDEIVAHRRNALADQLASRVGAYSSTFADAKLGAALVWFCVPDGAIAEVAQGLARRADWRRRIALHSSGALTSDELSPLGQRGAAVASVHPMMTFVHNAAPPLAGVTFAVEGGAAAVRSAARLVRDLKGTVFLIEKRDKPLYHALATLVSPLITAQFAAAERVAHALGLSSLQARNTIAPILRQTVENCLHHGPGAAFSGPLMRGDLDTVRRHLQVLKKIPEAREAYLALARVALKNLPVGRKKELARMLAGR